MTKTEWSTLNRERGLLIDKAIARNLTAAEENRLKELEAIAERHIEEVAPRPILIHHDESG